jgi:hypothetical protein
MNSQLYHALAVKAQCIVYPGGPHKTTNSGKVCCSLYGDPRKVADNGAGIFI